MQEEKKQGTNPIIMADYPDLDVIRVEDTYYMVSTTMHMMPGCVILRSYNLVNWEIASYVYETLDSTPGQRLADGKGIYGKGMWAASIRYHNQMFYICFVANDTGKTYIYKAASIEGPWEKHTIEGFFHDNSILFDEDGRVYILYGNRQIHLTELEPDLSKVKEGGIDKIILEDDDLHALGFEGAHFYKINGKYYAFFIHWPKFGKQRRTEACYVSDTVDGIYTGRDVLDDDLGYRNAGVAQGGIVDTPEGDWYAMLFQDYGALGRIPVLVPVHWENEFPVFGVEGKVPALLSVKDNRPGYNYQPLFENDDFDYVADERGKVSLKKVWQWNHEPDKNGWSVTERPGFLRLKTLDRRVNVVKAVNSITQRAFGKQSEAVIKLDGSGMKEGDYAGISAFMSLYSFLALTKEENGFSLVQLTRQEPEDDKAPFMGGDDNQPGVVCGKVAVTSPQVTLKVVCNFGGEVDTAECYYEEAGSWKKIGQTVKLRYTLDHFMGCRYAISYFATRVTGGVADFDSFQMKVIQ